MWLRYVDGTFVIQREDNKQNILQHINNVDPALRFTVEDNKEDGAIPFLDTIVKPEADGKLSFTVYKTHLHGPISTVGQLPSSISQVQCN